MALLDKIPTNIVPSPEKMLADPTGMDDSKDDKGGTHIPPCLPFFTAMVFVAVGSILSILFG